jgi:ubiquitin carboxyl-terminal hydrolase 36/42
MSCSCKTKREATKGMKIASAPPILTLHLKRFSVNYNAHNGKPRADKVNQFIQFPGRLDISPYMVDREVSAWPRLVKILTWKPS